MGADELDVVMNIPAMLSGDFRYVRDELSSLVRAVRMKSVNAGRGLVLVKVIVEACYFDDKMKRLVCKIIEDSGADFIKTSTGKAPGGATAKDVELFRDLLSENVGVKAAGGIRTADDAEVMINAGAARIGTSHAVEIVQRPSRPTGTSDRPAAGPVGVCGGSCASRSFKTQALVIGTMRLREADRIVTLYHETEAGSPR